MTQAADAMTTQVHPTPPDEALRLVHDRWRIEATSATPLDSEKDQNFRVKAADGRTFVLKLTNPAEPRGVTNLQTRAMQYIASQRGGVVVPEVLPDRDGDVEPVLALGPNPPQVVRLLTYLPGKPLHLTTSSRAQRTALGTTLARLTHALAGFTHPHADHEMAWDLKRAADVRAHLPHVADPDRRALATTVLDRFETLALPAFATLPTQVVHGDFNPFNVLVEPGDTDRIAGIIDFGDTVRTPRVNDLAIACAYHLDDAPEPFAHAAEIVAAYHAVTPLLPAELALLPVLVATRLVMGIALNHWRAALYPENATYILANDAKAGRGLARVADVPLDEAKAAFERACGTG